MTRRKILIFIVFFLCASASLRLNSPAQIRPIYDQGALGLAQQLKRLNTTASALMIGAHPDDEDTALLAYLARGENARTAYLSLTRGDGGQNIIGPELGEALGVIRTEELLQARKLDGAQQYFTRAYDFGFSKTLDEAKQKWDEKVILCDVVKIIRTYQPVVVISLFTGTPVDGHGQHQYAGYITPIGVRAAADAGQCPDSGPVWTVRKLYVRHRGPGDPTIRINTGKYDPLLGRSYFEIAMQARSQHRSQEQGVLELKGDQFSSLRLIYSKSATDAEGSIFGSIDTSLKAMDTIVELPPNFSRESLARVDALAARALAEYDVRQPEKIIPLLAEAWGLLDVAMKSSAVAGNESRRSPGFKQVGWKAQHFMQALATASGADAIALANTETAPPGSNVGVTVSAFLSGPGAVKVRDFELHGPEQWQITKTTKPGGATASGRSDAAIESAYFDVKIPPTAELTRPYWLVEPRADNLFRWADTPDRWLGVDGLPFNAPPVIAEIKLEANGTPFSIWRLVEFRYADDIRGEIRRPLVVVPKLAVALDQELIIVPSQSRSKPREVVVTVTNHSLGAVSGKIMLDVPAGWRTAPASTDFAMTRKGEKAAVRFSINIPPGTAAGNYTMKAEAESDGQKFSQTIQTIAYEHIQTQRIYRPSTATVKLIDLSMAPVKIGYIRGSGDRMLEAIKQLGSDVEEIDESLLAAGDLSRFDTIVVGIRAYQVRADIVANNQRLLNFARNGGTLIVQYQLPPTYSQPGLTPFPTQMGPRVADENATVTILQPTHPAFNFPNKISQDDFKGWVQERNLYNFSAMDAKYVGLLESHDAGEPDNNGGLVIADIGKGKFVYCSYSLFRQLPAGVPGAYRLLANLLSLGAQKRG